MSERQKPGRLGPLEAAGAYAYGDFFIQGRSRYRLPPERQEEFRQLEWAIIHGSPYPLRSMRERLYGTLPVIVRGVENIPTTGPFMFAANHYNQGVHRGNWGTPVIVDELARHLPDGDDRRISVVFTDSKDFVDSLETTVQAVDKSVAQALGMPIPIQRLMQPGIDYLRKGVEHALDNTAHTLGLLSARNPREIFRILHNGGIVGIYPTAEDEHTLKQGDRRAGRLFGMCARFNIPVEPVGIWHNPLRGEYHVNFGEARYYAGDRSFDDNDQLVVDAVMYDIAALLPQELRGVYKPKPFCLPQKDAAAD